MISVVVLPKLGVHQTMRLFLTGRRFDAREALAYGLVHRVVPADGLAAAVEEEIDALAQGGPIAIAEAKRLVRTVSRVLDGRRRSPTPRRRSRSCSRRPRPPRAWPRSREAQAGVGRAGPRCRLTGRLSRA